MFYVGTNYTGTISNFFLDLIGWVFVHVIGFVELTIAINTTGTSLFKL
jgi:hypothetical protein